MEAKSASTDWLKWPNRRISDQTIYHQGVWQQQEVKPSKLPPVITNKLTICTYNIWFGNERQQLRMKHLMNIVESNNCDIFCFQEVTQTLLQYILSSPFVQKYHLSGITADDTGAYGNVIFSRWPLTKVYLNHYTNSGMDRKLVCVDIIINNEIFRIGNVHLESLAPGAKKRCQQLKESMHFMLSKHKPLKYRPQHLMIMGDFNECATKSKEALKMKDKQFIDAWSEYHGGDGKYEKKYPGWTMPENAYFAAWRPDRIYYAFNYDYTINAVDDNNDDGWGDGGKKRITFTFPKKGDNDNDKLQDDEKKEENVDADVGGYVSDGKKGEWVLKNIRKVGMEKIEMTKEEEEEEIGDMITIWTPSDHYGLIVEFECKGMNNDEMEEIVKTRKIDDETGCVVL